VVCAYDVFHVCVLCAYARVCVVLCGEFVCVCGVLWYVCVSARVCLCGVRVCVWCMRVCEWCVTLCLCVYGVFVLFGDVWCSVCLSEDEAVNYMPMHCSTLSWTG
jgi:hypothetical protein